MSKQKFISPIAIDLGAKNTGVYFAHYPAGSSLDQIDKEGKVYQLDSQGYTYLMANRTAARHQRRGYDRRQMAKRLFKLIWCKHFGLEWGKDVQQTVSFLLNRRGFSFLDGEYDTDVLAQFPNKAFELLPDELKKDKSIKQNEIDDTHKFDSAVQDWARDKGKLEEKCLAMQSEIYLHKLYDACLKGEEYKESKNTKNSLRDIESKVYKRLVTLSVKGLEDAEKGSYAYKKEEEKDGKTQTVEKVATYKYQGDRYNLQAYVKYANQNQHIKHSIEDIKGNVPNISLWDFNCNPPKSGFDEDKFIEPEKTQNQKNQEREKYEKAYTEWRKTHLHHLVYALHKIHDELESGGRHRSKYFEEVKNVLERKDHTHGYLKRFYKNLQSGGFRGLTVDSLSNLIGHISNLELKPLRKYFNDEKHKDSDYWDESRLSEKFENWILREWRINPEKDKLKIDGATYAHKKLRRQWEGKSGTIVDFWLNTDPNLTIPPYQDNNNRRPPKCQSLLLNVGFLSLKYADWRKWLEELKKIESVRNYLGDYEKQLKELKSGKGKCYFSDKQTGDLLTDSGRRSMVELDARILQFIFDRVKDKDPLKLNEIYSHAKKIKQDGCKKDKQSIEEVKEAKIKLKEAIRAAVEKGSLPNKLCNNPDYKTKDLFPEGSFFHLICKYYKLRQRARDGRIFIHPEYGRGYQNTGRFDDKEHLLTYCNHKPRQKRYQMLEDLAKILLTTKDDLKSKMGISDGMESGKDASRLFDTVEQFFNDIKHKGTGLKGFMEDCAKAQKDYRGALKMMIDETHENYEECQNKIRKEREENDQKPYRNYQLRNQAKKKLMEEAAKNIKSKKSIEDKISRLIRLKEKSLDFAKLLAEKIHNDIGSDERDAIIEKFDNPFSLAQIYNIAYKDRYGNSKTCPVCSVDNSRRMDAEFSEEKGDFVAKSSRLPAMPTRVIDGAVRRIARIVGGAIAADKWERIKDELYAGHNVYIPIITESNQFEFEPSREELVIKQRPKSKPRKGEVLERGDEPSFEAKESRIRMSSRGVCPYTGRGLGRSGEIDHIIPRKSKRGTLNDEANLIWASIPGNQHKTNIDPSLAVNLHESYKAKIFPGKNDRQIKEWIVNQIGDGSGEFTFGKYRGFNNLSQDQQIAFRHALFLKGHPLRKKVIAAIDNRNRAFVNGTQRYFAEVLANELYKLAKRKKKESLLSFDYFGVPAYGDIDTDNVRLVRDKIENLKDDNGNPLHPELQNHKKRRGEEQEPPSHLTDAEVAFMIALSNHYRDGSFKINAPFIMPTEYVDEHGEEHDLYGKLKVYPSKTPELRRMPIRPKDSRFSHRPVFNSDPGAWHFLKLIEIRFDNEAVYLQGFVNLGKIKECLNHGNWKDALGKRYGHCYQKQEDQVFIPYAHIIERPDEWLELYRLGDGEHQFGYARKGKDISRTTSIKISSRKTAEIKIHNIDKTKVAKFLLKNFNTASNPKNWRGKDIDVCNKLCNIWYHTKRSKIVEASNLDVNIDQFKVKGLLDSSLYKAWNSLKESHTGNDGNEYFHKFLRQKFLGKNEKTHPHQKVRKHFSLPSKSGGQGWFLVRRKIWDTDKNRGAKFIYQCLSESNDFPKFTRGENNEELLAAQYRGKHIYIFPRSGKNMQDIADKLAPLDNVVDSEKWYERSVPENLGNVLSRVENQMGQDAKRACFRLTFANPVKLNSNEFRAAIKEYRPREINRNMFDLEIQDIPSRIECLKKDIEDINSKMKQERDSTKTDRLKQKLKGLKEELKYCQKLTALHSQIRNDTLIIQATKPFSSNPDK